MMMQWQPPSAVSFRPRNKHVLQIRAESPQPGLRTASPSRPAHRARLSPGQGRCGGSCVGTSGAGGLAGARQAGQFQLRPVAAAPAGFLAGLGLAGLRGGRDLCKKQPKVS